MVRLYGGQLQVLRFGSDISTSGWATVSAVNVSVAVGSTHKLRVTINDNIFDVYLDGEKTLTYAGDNNFYNSTNHGVRIATNDTTSMFDNFTIDPYVET